jgi:hypothetical protein
MMDCRVEPGNDGRTANTQPFIIAARAFMTRSGGERDAAVKFEQAPPRAC